MITKQTYCIYPDCSPIEYVGKPSYKKVTKITGKFGTIYATKYPGINTPFITITDIDNNVITLNTTHIYSIEENYRLCTIKFYFNECIKSREFLNIYKYVYKKSCKPTVYSGHSEQYDKDRYACLIKAYSTECIFQNPVYTDAQG